MQPNRNPYSVYPPGVSAADIDARFGDEESLEERQDIEAEKGDHARDCEVDNE